MRSIKIKNFAWLIIGVGLLTWVGLIFYKQGSLEFTSLALLQIPKVISINVLLWIAFIKWGWRWRIFRSWLVHFPDLSGSWKGTAVPKNTDPATGLPYPTVDLIVTIKQTFLYIHVKVESNEMESNSYSSSFMIDSETDEKRLCYSYLSKPKANIRSRSPIHDGTALLTIKGSNENKLNGEYWTNRASTGEIYLEKSRSKK